MAGNMVNKLLFNVRKRLHSRGTTGRDVCGNLENNMHLIIMWIWLSGRSLSPTSGATLGLPHGCSMVA